MNSENREGIDKFIETQVAGDTNAHKSDRAAGVTESYVAQEIMAIEKNFESSVLDAMALTNKTMESDPDYYHDLMGNRETLIGNVLRSVFARGGSVAEAQEEIDKTLLTKARAPKQTN
jgi:hypothetical protein